MYISDIAINSSAWVGRYFRTAVSVGEQPRFFLVVPPGAQGKPRFIEHTAGKVAISEIAKYGDQLELTMETAIVEVQSFLTFLDCNDMQSYEAKIVAALSACKDPASCRLSAEKASTSFPCLQCREVAKEALRFQRQAFVEKHR